MLTHLSREVTDILPAITAMFVMCVAMAPFVVVGTALASWRKQRNCPRKDSDSLSQTPLAKR